MQFRTLRLSGFKSFVEPAEIEIAAGLTGIVGPNGCGKSNIVEALRWVMGEMSAKRMRGGEMDDVIFNGSSQRPARNIAEVTVTVANDGGPLPAMFQAFPELEIRRRIERGSGSDYRVNGRPVRARDVQLLFADAAIGASSPAMVSQGRISALIAAKPIERRFILEDAAGIGGLQSRRHEAELKLKAAEANMAQLDSVLETLRGQENGLKRQARQAEKFRQLSTRLREAEALLLYCNWMEAWAKLDATRAALAAVESRVHQAMTEIAASAARTSAAEATLAAARLADQEAQGRLRQWRGREQGLLNERRQIEQAMAQAERDVAQGSADLAHEDRERGEAEAALTRLDAEAASLREALPDLQAAMTAAEADEQRQQAGIRDAEAAVLAANTIHARQQADRDALARQLREAQGLETSTKRTLDQAREALARLDDASAAVPLGPLEKAVDKAKIALKSAQEAVEPAREARRVTELSVQQAGDIAAAAKADETRATAEIAGLNAALAATTRDETADPVLNQLVAVPGFEASLAAALGDDARASTAQGAHHWKTLPAGMLSPPIGTEPLRDQVQIPAALERAMAGIGITSAEDAVRLQLSLLPGQAIVTSDGALYRWDGLIREAGAGAGGPVAATLSARNRLAALETELTVARARSAAADEILTKARTSSETAAAGERAALNTVSTALTRTQQADAALAAATVRAAQATRQHEQAKAALDMAGIAASQVNATVATLTGAQGQLPDPALAGQVLAVAQAALAAARAQATAANNTTRDAQRRQEQATARLPSIADECGSWKTRLLTRAQRRTEIQERIDAARATLGGVSARPGAIAAELETVTRKIDEAEQLCRVRSDAVIRAEGERNERNREARAGEQVLAAAREDRARAETQQAAADEARLQAEQTIERQLHLDAAMLAETIEQEQALVGRGDIEQRIAALTREREAIGPVNLRAELELEEALTQITRIETDAKDLEDAISSLRQAIIKLNREARERLGAAFETVRVNFKRLFATLFGGGEADLTLTNLADPLEAGLEIFASPPGKTLQSLSLLSGGEQALTALALLFAMFLATPAPVCVLDEVDAPLDDANVTRFCDLLDEISRETGTRFLVITHHRVTMARMDRLYGVTMAERGISMLVSVDLRAAESLIDHDDLVDTPIFAGAVGRR